MKRLALTARPMDSLMRRAAIVLVPAALLGLAACGSQRHAAATPSHKVVTKTGTGTAALSHPTPSPAASGPTDAAALAALQSLVPGATITVPGRYGASGWAAYSGDNYSIEWFASDSAAQQAASQAVAADYVAQAVGQYVVIAESGSHVVPTPAPEAPPSWTWSCSISSIGIVYAKINNTGTLPIPPGTLTVWVQDNPGAGAPWWHTGTIETTINPGAEWYGTGSDANPNNWNCKVEG